MDQDSEQQLGEAADTNGFLPGSLARSRTNRGIQAAAGTQACLQEQLGQPADPIGLSQEFCTNLGEVSQAAAGKRPLTQQLLGQSLTRSTEDPYSQRNIGAIGEEEALLVKKTEIEEVEEKEQPKKSSLKEALGAENGRLECKIEENEKLREALMKKFFEEVRRSWNCEAFEAENRILKRKTEVKEQLPKSFVKRYLAFLMWLNHHIDRTAQQVGEAAGKYGFLSGFMSSLTTNQAVARTQLWLQKQLGQSAETIRLFLPLIKKPIVSFPKFWKYQGQSSQTGAATQPTSTGNTHSQRNFDEISENEAQLARKREMDRAYRSKVKEERQALVDENDQLKLEIQEKVNLIQEKDQMIKSYMKVFKANSKRLKREIEETEQLMKINLAAFEAEEWRLKREIEEKEQLMKSSLEASENGRLKAELKGKEQLMKSDVKAFESESLQREIGEIEEKEPVMRSSLESEIRSLMCEIKEKVQLMKSNLEAFEAENQRLRREIEEKEQLMESNMETLEAETRRLNNEMESLKGNNISVNWRVQLQSVKLADLRNKYDELKQQKRIKKRPRISSTRELLAAHVELRKVRPTKPFRKEDCVTLCQMKTLSR